MKLYYTPGTSAFRCRWLIEELGADHEVVPVDLGKGEHKTPEYVANVHPLGSVPALVHGEQTLIESAAIVLYLADQDPELRLAPPLASPERGLYYQWTLFAMTGLYNTVHGPYVRVFFGGAAASEEERAAFARQLAITDEQLDKHPFLLGDTFSAADVIFGGLLVWADAAGLLAGREPQTSYLARLRERPAFKRAEADPSGPSPAS